MAHFYVSAKGSRGETTRVGSKNSGLRAHVRGWLSGVRIEAHHLKTVNVDRFEIYATSGSNGGEEKHIGYVTLDKNGKPILVKL